MYLTNETITNPSFPAQAIEIKTPEIVHTKFGAVLVEEIRHGRFSLFTAKLGEFSRVGRTVEIAVAALEKDLLNEIQIKLENY